MGNVSEQNVKWFVRYRPGRTNERTDGQRPDSTIPPKIFFFVGDNNEVTQGSKVELGQVLIYFFKKCLSQKLTLSETDKHLGSSALKRVR